MSSLVVAVVVVEVRLAFRAGEGLGSFKAAMNELVNVDTKIKLTIDGTLN